MATRGPCHNQFQRNPDRSPGANPYHDHKSRPQPGTYRRDHAAVSGAARPPSARVVARLLSAVDFRPAVLELLNPRFPPDVRGTAASALRVAEMGPAAAFAPTHAPGAWSSSRVLEGFG